MQAKYTFFEIATQNGFVIALMNPHFEKSRDSLRIETNLQTGTRYLHLSRAQDPEKIVFTFQIPERDTTETQLMWRAKTEQAFRQAWKDFKNPPKAPNEPVEQGV